MFKLKKMLIVASLLGVCNSETFSQTNVNGQINTITTAVPFLRIGPDSRSGAMGDVGVALSPDAFGSYWNVGKMAMIKDKGGIALGFSPWLRALGIDDIFLAHLTAFKKFGDNQTAGINFKYFSLGSIAYTDIQGSAVSTGNPREFSIDGYYSRKFSSKFSGGVALRYIYSALNTGATDPSLSYSPGKAVAADLGFYYNSNQKDKLNLGDEFAWGVAITNIGSKISYTQTEKDFIPTNLALGVAYTKQIDEFNKITFSTDVNKLLVPTPLWDTASQSYYIPTSKTPLEGIFSSFTDAPGGGKEELRELTVGVGAEYTYQEQFSLRGGYFYENKYKGARQYVSLGAGFKYTSMGLDLSYIVPSTNSFNTKLPLSNTLRVSLKINLNGENQNKEDNPANVANAF